jgi:NSS family neurotransmitter:Na+ symporter
MWRFSYQASESGGAAFVLLYIVFVAIVGIPILTSEFVVGRMTQESPAVALRRLGGRAWAPLGWLFVFCGLGILSYYAVIAGWTMRYALDAVRNAIPSDTGAYFGAVASGWDAVAWQVLFMALTIGVVARGVKGGLEKTNIVLMPLLFLILVSLAIWAFTLPNGGAGYARYLQPSLAEVFRVRTVAAAAGQAFFSLSLGMGAMMTYASYLTSQQNLGREAATIALTDTAVAFVAGLVVFPVIFNFGLEARISESTVGALFIALPAGFDRLGRLGDFVDTAFFVMLFFAALTSGISLLEVVVAAAVDGLRWTRARAAVVLGIVITLLGMPLAFDTDRLGAADQVVGNFLLIVGGFFICLLVGHKLLPQADAELARGLPSAGARRAWSVVVRFVAPALLLFVMYTGWGITWAAVRTLLGVGS